MLSQRIKNLEPSPTLSLDAKVKELEKNGEKIINLGLGEPDFPTPKNICEAGKKALDEGFTHYTQAAGILPLRQAIANYLRKFNNIEFSPDEIVVGVGTKTLLYNLFQVLCNPGDEVLVHTPTWSTYLEQIKLAGGVPVEITLESPFKLTANKLTEKITSKTKIILLNSPCNPTGAIIDEEELEKFGQVAAEKNIFIISDEIYDRINYGEKPTSIASISEEIKNRIITVNGFSKAYAMTGWRIGWAAGPKEIIKALVSFQGQTTSNTFSIAQKAAIAALEENQSPVDEMRSEFEKRRNFLASELGKINGLEFTIPEGAFYFFVSVKNYLNPSMSTSTEFCRMLLEQDKVAVVPGEAFHAPGYFRLSFAASMTDLQKGVDGLNNFISKL